MQCSEETKKNGDIVVVLDNARAIAKLRGDIRKRSGDLAHEKEQIITIARQIERTEQQLETLLAAPAIGADVNMGGLEEQIIGLNQSLKEVQDRLGALNREMSEKGVKLSGQRNTFSSATDCDPAEGKQKVMRQISERFITMHVLDPTNLKLI